MKRIFVLLFILLVSIMFFEFFLRYSPFSSGISPVEYDQDIGMWHKKDFSGYLIKECYKSKYTFDEEGKVANNYQYDKTKRDIILLGDSQIEALMVQNSAIIHNSLYKELEAKYNILNYGLSGTGPAQQFQIAKMKVNLNKVDSILHFVFLENDLNDADPKNFTSANRPKVYMKFSDLESFKVIKPREYNIKEKIRDFLGNFELYVYLKKSFYYYSSLSGKSSLNNAKLTLNFELTNEKYKWNQLFGSIYQINKLAKQLNVKYNVVIYSMYEFKDGYIEKREKFENFLKNNHISNINIVPFLKKLSQNEELSFRCDGHWNSDTHRNIAKYLKRELF